MGRVAAGIAFKDKVIIRPQHVECIAAYVPDYGTKLGSILNDIEDGNNETSKSMGNPIPFNLYGTYVVLWDKDALNNSECVEALRKFCKDKGLEIRS